MCPLINILLNKHLSIKRTGVKKMEGFTLIELLAVIVILGIIMLIATPLILNVINDARKGSLKNSTYGIIKAAENEHIKMMVNNKDFDELAFSYVNGEESSNITGKKLDYRGTKPDSGTVLINKEGKIGIAIHNGKWCAEKGYEDSEVTVTDKARKDCVLDVFLPTIELIGNNPLHVEINTEYTDPGVIAKTKDGVVITDVITTIQINGEIVENIDMTKLETYEVTYRAAEDDKVTELTRKVIVRDTTPPILTVPISTTITIEEVNTFDYLKDVTVEDNSLETIEILTSGDISRLPGEYLITYTVEDLSGNKTTETRKIIVVDNESPVITIIGNNPIKINVGETYVDLGATAIDNLDGDLTVSITTSGLVNSNIIGEYEITYTVQDSSGNIGKSIRLIEVVDNVPPVVTGITTNVTNITSNNFTITRSGDATDVHSDLAANPYIYQISTNGTTWTTKCTNNNTNCLVTDLSDNTTYYYRVCAVDIKNNQSCVGSKTTKTLVKILIYYYDKYNTIDTKESYVVETGSTSWNDAGNTRPLEVNTTYYTSFSFNQSTGTYSFSGPVTRNAGSMPLIGYYYSYAGIAVFQNESTTYTQNGKTYNHIKWWYTTSKYSRGALVQVNITGTESEYPVNGRFATDGYWYVRKGLAN